MTDNIVEILKHRATILHNIDGIYSYGLKAGKDKQQMSLFGDATEAKVTLAEPVDVDYGDLLEKENNVLGVYLTHNPFDSYVLIEKKFCNNNIESLLDISKEHKGGIVLLARVAEINPKTSIAGNSYAKLIIRDASSSFMVYLWGKKYGELIECILKDQIYLIELGFKQTGNTFFVVNMRKADDIPIEKLVKNISLYIPDIKNIPKIRNYVFDHMIGSNYIISFIYNGEKYTPTYKVDFSGDDYHYLKDFIYNIEV